MPKPGMNPPVQNVGAKDMKKALGALMGYCKKYVAVILIAICCAAFSAVLAVSPSWIGLLSSKLSA